MGAKTLGSFELVVMMAMTRLGAQAYGMSIRQSLSERLAKDVSIGAVYATLERLERKGFVKSRIGEATKSRGGKAKKHFEITGAGQVVMTQSIADVDRMRMSPTNGGLANA